MKAEHCWYKQRVADALEAQISSHGSSILSEALHRALRYINIESLRQAIIRELQKRGEPV
jgi:hypothetical protein